MPKIFEIDFNYERGTVVSLKKPDDKAHMNWVEGTEEWGMIKGAEVVSVEKNENGLTAVYRTKHLLVTVQRQVLGDKYRESYCFETTMIMMCFSTAGQWAYMPPLTITTIKRAFV